MSKISPIVPGSVLTTTAFKEGSACMIVSSDSRSDSSVLRRPVIKAFKILAASVASAYFNMTTCVESAVVAGLSSFSTNLMTSVRGRLLPFITRELLRSLAMICTFCGPVAPLPICSGASFSSKATTLPTQASLRGNITTSSSSAMSISLTSFFSLATLSA